MRFERYLTMAVAGEVSYVRRFAGKFVEIVAAGIGTAVSGYLVAYITGHLAFFSFLTPAAVKPSPPPQVSGWPTAPRENASIEATVRAALASHDVSRAAPVVATAQPPASDTPETTASVPAVVPPLDATEVRSLPVAAAVDAPLPVEPDAWPSDPTPMSGAGRLLASSGRLPPQPPPANVNLLAALKHFF
jgi:hypothetical protein